MDEDAVAENTALIYVGFADLMRKFQLIEWSLGQIKALQFKPGIQLDQAFAKVEGWDNMTYGQMVSSVLGPAGEWPEDLVKALKDSVAVRNYLAHKFLREFFLVRESQEVYDKAANQLVEWDTDIEALEAALEAKVQSMGGVETWDDLDEETQAEIEAMRPTDWPI